jgi:hypothetical protein
VLAAGLGMFPDEVEAHAERLGLPVAFHCFPARCAASSLSSPCLSAGDGLSFAGGRNQQHLSGGAVAPFSL